MGYLYLFTKIHVAGTWESNRTQRELAVLEPLTPLCARTDKPNRREPKLPIIVCSIPVSNPRRPRTQPRLKCWTGRRPTSSTSMSNFYSSASDREKKTNKKQYAINTKIQSICKVIYLFIYLFIYLLNTHSVQHMDTNIQ